MTQRRSSHPYDAEAVAELDDGGLLVERVDRLRRAANRRLAPQKKSALGQFFTPAPVAQLMASLIRNGKPQVTILDAGAGVGSLFSACVAELCARERPPERIEVYAYEADASLARELHMTMDCCARLCDSLGMSFDGHVMLADFIESTVSMLCGNLFSTVARPSFNCAILNPPYRKIHSQSRERKLLRQLGIETSNLYTGFLAAAIHLLEPDGELVAITPRSFCNGPYFRPFRELLLRSMALQQLHLFDSRQRAFQEDEVLQENVILHAIKGAARPASVRITSSAGPVDELMTVHTAPFETVVRPTDPQAFIHIVTDQRQQSRREQGGALTSSLDAIGLEVSTGRVVDFRAREYLRAQPEAGTVPLIYPAHFAGGGVQWPKLNLRKPNALVVEERTRPQLVPNGNYVLTRRFSSKEEPRRVVAVVYEGARIPCAEVGLENHINYFHEHGRGFDLPSARGLCAFLNSTLVDTLFRQFNGHTQVNATDLRSMRYPSREQLRRIGELVGESLLSQDELDALIEGELAGMTSTGDANQTPAQQRVEQAIALRELGLPSAQQNERSALTLLALLDVRPDMPWERASNPLRGVTPLMEFMAEHYGKTYAPNTRETVRRQTLHQFLDAGIVLINPDEPSRPTNSGNTVYQIEPGALALLQSFGRDDWHQNLQAYLSSIEMLKERYAQQRRMQRIPVTVAPGKTLTLSPGGQNILIEQIISEFGARFAPGGVVLYIGDTDEKFAYFDAEGLARLGVSVEPHGKMPDVILHSPEKSRLLLIEAVTSHGPINPKRRGELERLFTDATVPLVFVTAFLDRKTMTKYLTELAWETEVWLAEAPDHLVHFDGDQFISS